MKDNHSAFSSMAALTNENISRGRDWDIVLRGAGLALRLQTMYPVFKKWAREHEFEGEIMDELSFRKQLRHEPYYVGRQSVRMFKNDEAVNGKVRKAIILDVFKLQDAGIDLSGFIPEKDNAGIIE